MSKYTKQKKNTNHAGEMSAGKKGFKLLRVYDYCYCYYKCDRPPFPFPRTHPTSDVVASCRKSSDSKYKKGRPREGVNVFTVEKCVSRVKFDI